MRPKIGIYDGVPLSVVPHATTGRADYFGAVVNRAARLMAVAQGGQVGGAGAGGRGLGRRVRVWRVEGWASVCWWWTQSTCACRWGHVG